ncbi:MAG: DUF4834 family protein [Muribaculaceae bacterium]|nr:DUF4834 family protein [Muribaculaceae bacterium]
MFALLLFILIIFILWPFIKLAWKLWRNVRQAQRFMRDPFGEAMRQAQEQARRSEGTHTRNYGTNTASYSSKKKKIGRDVGEYVPFTEVADQQTAKTADSAKTNYTTESQVSDVEWEDL